MNVYVAYMHSIDNNTVDIIGTFATYQQAIDASESLARELVKLGVYDSLFVFGTDVLITVEGYTYGIGSKPISGAFLGGVLEDDTFSWESYSVKSKV